MAVDEAKKVEAAKQLTGLQALEEILQVLRDVADYLSAIDTSAAIRAGKDPRRMLGDAESTVSPLAQRVYDVQRTAQAMMGTMIAAEGQVKARDWR